MGEDIKNKVRAKRKVKKNPLAILFIVIIIVTIGVFIAFNNFKSLNIKPNTYIITTKDTELFNKNKKSIGKIYKNTKIKIEKTDGGYIKLIDSDMYLKKGSVKSIKKIKNKIKDYYLPFNKSIKSNKIDLYMKNKKVITINNNINIPIYYMDKDYYYVSFLGNVFSIKKDNSIEEIDSNNTKEKESNSIAVINYDTIYSNEECGKITCIKDTTYLEHLKYLKESGYYTIGLDDYEKYIDGYIRLKDKAILLTTSNTNDTVNKLNKENELKIELVSEKSNLVFVNSSMTPNTDKEKLNRYNIKSSTSIDTFKKMVNKENVKDPYPFEKSSSEQSIPVLNYHFFYDSSIGESCGEDICLDTSMFRKHLDYLKNNGYKTLTMEEFTEWMYGDIELPEKSVLITVDDGAAGTGKHNGNKLIPILEEYNMYATLFLITGWWDVENYRSKNLDIQSHTQDMHNRGSCGSGQVVCATREELLNDLNTSLTIVDNNNSFCFPFYQYSDLSLKTVEEAGFKLSFIGGNVNAKRSDNKYKIPRYPIHASQSYEYFVSIFE